MESLKVLAAIAGLALILGLFNKQDVLPVPGTEPDAPQYKPIRTDTPLPKEIFGLRQKEKGIWVNASGEEVYKQARVYKGGSKPRPLPPVRKDGCLYNPKEPVNVILNSNKYPASALHIYIGARNGVPQLLHINRDPGYDIRSNSLEGISSNSTYDRDESPFAISNEAAVYNRSVGTSDIAYIPFSDNRGSGSSMGGQLSKYCTGQPFRIVLQPAK